MRETGEWEGFNNPVGEVLEDIWSTPNEWMAEGLPGAVLNWGHQHDQRMFLVFIADMADPVDDGVDWGATRWRRLVPMLRRLAVAAGAEQASSSGP